MPNPPATIEILTRAPDADSPIVMLIHPPACDPVLLPMTVKQARGLGAMLEEAVDGLGMREVEGE